MSAGIVGDVLAVFPFDRELVRFGVYGNDRGVGAALKASRRVPARKFTRDGKAENLPDGLMGSFGDIARAACLNRKHDVPNMARLDGINGQMTDDGEDISLKPIHQGLCMPRRLADGPPCPPFSGDLFKAVVSLTLKHFDFLLLRFGLSLRSVIGLMPDASSFFAAK
jgi:hypothetical protein